MLFLQRYGGHLHLACDKHCANESSSCFAIYEAVLQSKKELSNLVSIIIPAIIISTVYFGFYFEISHYFQTLFQESEVTINKYEHYNNYDILKFETIWLLIYSMVFATALSITVKLVFNLASENAITSPEAVIVPVTVSVPQASGATVPNTVPYTATPDPLWASIAPVVEPDPVLENPRTTGLAPPDVRLT